MKKTLKELILDFEQELLRLGYTKESITFCKRRWKMHIPISLAVKCLTGVKTKSCFSGFQVLNRLGYYAK